MVNHCECKECRHEQCVQRVPIFSDLPPQAWEMILRKIQRKPYKKDEFIMEEGVYFDSLAIIHSGEVKTFSYSREGREQIFHLLYPGDFFGEMNLFRDRLPTYSAQAIKDSLVCHLHRDDFHQVLLEFPKVALNIMQTLSLRWERLIGLVQNIQSGDVDARVLMMLLEFSKKYGEHTPQGVLIRLPLSREGLANYIGVTRETMSRKLHQLQSEGLIELIDHRQILIFRLNDLEQY
jgi:CRP-like cAMP-binding protein